MADITLYREPMSLPPADYSADEPPEEPHSPLPATPLITGHPGDGLKALSGPPPTSIVTVAAQRVVHALGAAELLAAAALNVVVAFGPISKAGDGTPVASNDGPKTPGSRGLNTGTSSSADTEQTPEPQPDPGAAGARKGPDGGVPPPPSRATEYLRTGNPELDDQVARVRAARDSGDPAAKEALRQEEIKQLTSDIDDLHKQIPTSQEPERGALVSRVSRMQDRLRELTKP